MTLTRINFFEVTRYLPEIYPNFFLWTNYGRLLSTTVKLQLHQQFFCQQKVVQKSIQIFKEWLWFFEARLLKYCTPYRRSPWKCTRTAGDVQEGNHKSSAQVILT